MTETVRAGNLITLHYRVATGDDTELVSTFDSTPATLEISFTKWALITIDPPRLSIGIFLPVSMLWM